MAEHGGKRTPAKPAAVSGPGALSARTDGGPTVGALDQLSSGKYGETQALNQVAGGAPVAASGPSVGSQALAGALSQGGLNFGAPSAQPNTPVTAGSQYGPGPDQSALQQNDPTRQTAQQLQQSGVLPLMIRVADSDGASDAYRRYVRIIIAALT